MMNRLLNQILWKQRSPGHLILGGAGFSLGLLLVLFCVQVYLDINHIFTSRLSLEKQADYIILSKEVDLKKQNILSKSAFSDEEIKELKAQPFALDLGIIRANRYAASASVNMMGQGFVTDLFFEALPDRFLDTLPAQWHWEEGEEVVPVMISRDFLLLYNFGFSQSRGFPLISEELVSQIPMEIYVSGEGKGKKFRARIVGLSDRISSILVPYNFMEWANTRYGPRGPHPPYRLILSVNDRSNPAIIRYLETRRYETSREKLRLSDAGFTITIVLSVIAAIGLLLIVLAFLVFVTTFRLIIARAGKEISLLLQLGYTSGMILKNLMITLSLILVAVLFSVALLFTVARVLFHNFLISYGISPRGGYGLGVYLLGVLLIAGALVINFISLKLSVNEKEKD